MSLKNLIALQKANKEGVKPDEIPSPREDVRDETPSAESPSNDAGAQQSGHVPPASPSTASDVPRATGLGLNRLGALKGGLGAATLRPVPEPAVPPAERGAGEAESAGDGPVEFSLDDIAALDEQSTPVVVSRERDGSGFDDEIEATAPDRDLPEDVTPQMIGFVEQLDNIYQVLNDPDMFSQSIRILMMELQENPEYEKLVSDQDVHTMIRAMRNTMGLAKIRKQEKSKTAKRSTAAKKKGAVTDDVMGVLDSLGFGDDD